jgi:hypothetical protein
MMEEQEQDSPLALVMSAAILPVFFVLAGLCVGLTLLVYYLIA